MTTKLDDSNLKISNTVTVGRVFALISIVSAHILFKDSTSQWIVTFYKMIGSIGVAAYFIFSGYYYHIKKYGSLLNVTKSKLKTIGIPWIVIGSVGYLYNAILSKNLSVETFLKFIIGNGSYLYFMTMLFLCFMIFYFFNSKVFLVLAMVLNIISLELTSFGLLESVISALHITNYLNILNWIGFFALGMLAQKIDSKTLSNKIIKFRIPAIFAFILAFIVLFITKVQTGYFTYIGWIYEILGAIAIISISSFDFWNVKFIRMISNDSFTIYLIHFMMIGVFDRIYNLFLPLQVVANLIIICLSFVILEVVMLIAKKIKLDNFASIVLGVRKR